MACVGQAHSEPMLTFRALTGPANQVAPDGNLSLVPSEHCCRAG